MTTIWKYILPAKGRCTRQMPAGAQILSVGNQVGTIVMWALVDDDHPLVNRHFAVVLTGDPANAFTHDQFIGTVLLHRDEYVAHVFVLEEGTVEPLAGP